VCLTAASWDALAAAALADGAAGAVHSVFDRACNLGCTDGGLVGIVGPAAGNGPATLVLAAPPAIALTALGPEVNGGWRVVNRVLGFENATLRINLAEARVWQPPRALVVVAPEALRARLARAAHVSSATAPRDGLAPLLGRIGCLLGDEAAAPSSQERHGVASDMAGGTAGLLGGAVFGPGRSAADLAVVRAASAVWSLVHAWRGGDTMATAAAARSLSGLGPGLTPSGDDLLAGFLIGTVRASGRLDPRLADAVVAATLGRTNDIAGARVRHAAAGRIEERMDDVVTALLGESDAALEDAVGRAVRWGHTSGIDILVGLLLGMGLVLRSDRAGWPSSHLSSRASASDRGVFGQTSAWQSVDPSLRSG